MVDSVIAPYILKMAATSTSTSARTTETFTDDEFQCVKSKKGKKRRLEDDKMEAETSSKRPSFPPLSGEKLLVSFNFSVVERKPNDYVSPIPNVKRSYACRQVNFFLMKHIIISLHFLKDLGRRRLKLFKFGQAVLEILEWFKCRKNYRFFRFDCQ